MKKIIHTDHSPAAVGPYSQGVKVDNLLFTSGQLPMDPITKELKVDITAATHQALQNLEAILKEAGSGLEHAIKVVVYLADINDFAAMNEVYGSYFTKNPPARSAFEVAALPMGAVVEIEAIALIP